MMLNGIYYEVIGEGKPIILIHGNNEDHTIFSNYILEFKDYKLVLIDSRGHGQSNQDKTSLQEIKKDIFNIINHLNLIDPILIGFSDGANVIMLMLQDKSFSKTVLIGGNSHPKGLKLFERIKIHLSLNRKNINLMLKEPLLKGKTFFSNSLLIYGDKDCISKKHIKELKTQFINSKFKIINGNHYILNESIPFIRRYLND